jgi:hypothetical protein
MSTSATRDAASTSYAHAPTRALTADGVTYAYRELGPTGGIPVNGRTEDRLGEIGRTSDHAAAGVGRGHPVQRSGVPVGVPAVKLSRESCTRYNVS